MAFTPRPIRILACALAAGFAACLAAGSGGGSGARQQGPRVPDGVPAQRGHAVSSADRSRAAPDRRRRDHRHDRVPRGQPHHHGQRPGRPGPGGDRPDPDQRVAVVDERPGQQQPGARQRQPGVRGLYGEPGLGQLGRRARAADRCAQHRVLRDGLAQLRDGVRGVRGLRRDDGDDHADHHDQQPSRWHTLQRPAQPRPGLLRDGQRDALRNDHQREPARGLSNGNTCTAVPGAGGFGACDHLFEVAQPVQSWGNSVPVANLPNRSFGSIYRIIASQDGTQILQDGDRRRPGARARAESTRRRT